MGPLSPPDLKPDTAALLNGNAGTFSPGNNNNGGGPGSPGAFSQISLQQTTSSGGVQMGLNTPSNRQQYPPNHPLSGSKHLCSICGDRASGKHYGVYRYNYVLLLFVFILTFCMKFSVVKDVKDSLNEQ